MSACSRSGGASCSTGTPGATSFAVTAGTATDDDHHDADDDHDAAADHDDVRAGDDHDDDHRPTTTTAGRRRPRRPRTATTATTAPPTGRFVTLPPGSALPSRRGVRRRVRPARRDPPAERTSRTRRARRADPTQPAARTPGSPATSPGTTDEIIQWAACKWGFDEDVVRAQTAKESWWTQHAGGDLTTDASRCPPGHGIGVDGHPGQCPESYGVQQVRYPYFAVGVQPTPSTSTRLQPRRRPGRPAQLLRGQRDVAQHRRARAATTPPATCGAASACGSPALVHPAGGDLHRRRCRRT